MWNGISGRWKEWTLAIFLSNPLQLTTAGQAETDAAPGQSQPLSGSSSLVQVPDTSELPRISSIAVSESKTVCSPYVEKYEYGSGKNRIRCCIYKEPVTDPRMPEPTRVDHISPSRSFGTDPGPGKGPEME
jgi:hypothetical protein